jgi:hypothetical protein
MISGDVAVLSRIVGNSGGGKQISFSINPWFLCK